MRTNRKPAKTESPPAAPSPADNAAWECDLCDGQNAAADPICRKCLRGFAPELLPPARHLLAVLQPTGALDELRRRTTAGATDAELLRLLVERLPADGFATTEEEPVSWTTENGPGGLKLAIWFGSLSAVNNDPDRRPDWIGADAVAALREAFHIAKPATSAARGMPELIRLDQIDPSPINPRQHFDPAALQELAESLKQHGQLQEALVYHKFDGRLELIAGERRFRAAKLAELTELRCRVLDLTPAQAAELRHEENAKREDLTAIEQAKSYEALLSFGLTQAQLAERLGVSQPQIANRLRLLRLPAEWQARVIRREIPEAHARELVSWSDLPPFLKDIDERIQQETGVPSLREWRGWIGAALDSISRPIKANDWYHFSQKTKRGFDYKNGRVLLTDADIEQNREALNLRDVPGRNDKTETRAFNVAQWWKLQSARQDEEKKAEKSRERKEAKSAPAAKLTPKQKEAADKARRARSAEMLKAKLARYKTGWYQTAIAAAVREPKRIDGAAYLQILLWFAAASDWRGEREAALRTVLNDAFKVTMKRGAANELAALNRPKAAELVRETIAAWAMLEPKEFNAHWTPATIAALAGFLEIEIEKEWTIDGEFLALHSSEQLAPLVKEWKLAVDMKAKTRGELIDRILAAAAGKKLPTPRELLK